MCSSSAWIVVAGKLKKTFWYYRSKMTFWSRIVESFSDTVVSILVMLTSRAHNFGPLGKVREIVKPGGFV